MDTAKSLFATYGFYGTPTAKIAADAGVSNGILFHYFPTKDVLIEALYLDVKDQLFSYTISQLYQGGGLKEHVYTFWLAAVEWNLEHPNDFTFLMHYKNSPKGRVNVEHEIHPYNKLCHELANKGTDQQLFKHVAPEVVYEVMIGMVSVTVQFSLLNPELQDDFAYKNRLFEMTWDALAK